MSQNVLDAWNEKLQSGDLTSDPIQEAAAGALDRLRDRILTLPKNPKRTRIWHRLFRRRTQKPRISPQGIYLWGSVGRGKSMLMDMFFDTIPDGDKQRIHFHSFMQEVHRRIHLWRSQDASGRRADFPNQENYHADDPIIPTAKWITQQGLLICLDELQVTEVVDALLIGRLFQALLDNHAVVVITSNRAPPDLYKHGRNRELFLPFIALIEKHLYVVHLDGPTDYRLIRLQGYKTWYSPSGFEATKRLREIFFRLTGIDPRMRDVPSEDLQLGGRSLHVPKSAEGVAVFSFKRLCLSPLGAADYLALARRYHTLILVAIPKLSQENYDGAKRFITLVDILYDHRIKLFCSAETTPEDLYTEGLNAFEFERCVSRLIEMQSDAWLQSCDLSAL